MQKLAIIFLLGLGFTASAQQRTFIEVDTSSYNQYLRGEWKELIENGEQALENNIDYYYLQMRIAYAYFSLGKYRKASTYYENALRHNSKDPIANEYLYHCLKYSGRDNFALIQAKNLSLEQKKRLNVQDSAFFMSFGLKYTYGASDAQNIINPIVSELGTTENGLQKAALSLKAPEASFSHRLGRHIIAHHSGSYLQKNELSYALVEGVEYLSPEQIVKQVEYNLNVELALGNGWLIRPGLHFLNSSIPIFSATEYGNSFGIERSAVDAIKINNKIFNLYIEKQLNLLDIGISYANLDFHEMKTHQIGLHTNIYPLSNLNFYISFDAYGQHLSYADYSKISYTFTSLIGGKIAKNLWVEMAGSFPERFAAYDMRNSIAYNNLEKTNHAISVSAIIPLYEIHSKIFFSYQYSGQSSYFFPDANQLQPINQQSFTNHLITGGIKWTI